MRTLARHAVPAMALLLTAATAGAADRLDQFRALAAERPPDARAESARPWREALLGLLDAEILDNLTAGGPMASEGFIQERLDILAGEWGGIALGLHRLAGAGAARAVVLAGIDGASGLGSLRLYGTPGAAAGDAPGREPGSARPGLLAASEHDGRPELHVWPGERGAPGPAPTLLVLWTGAALGPGSAPIVAEAWRWPAGGAPTRIWSSTALFPDGLAASEVRVARHELAVRYEVRLPGLAAGCQDPLEQRDLFRLAPGGERLVLARREVRNGWRRELQVALGRLLRAVEVNDGRALAQLAPRPEVRGRLPRALTAEPACETTTAHAPHEAPRVVVTAATAADGERPRPWSLEWSRVAGAWRLTDAYPVLK